MTAISAVLRERKLVWCSCHNNGAQKCFLFLRHCVGQTRDCFYLKVNKKDSAMPWFFCLIKNLMQKCYFWYDCDEYMSWSANWSTWSLPTRTCLWPATCPMWKFCICYCPLVWMFCSRQTNNMKEIWELY